MVITIHALQGALGWGVTPSWGMSIPNFPNYGETEADRVTYE